MGHIQDIKERFWKKVEIIEDKDSCWNWTAFIHSHPRKENVQMYGMFWVGNKNNGTGKMASAHRISWELEYGKIPENMKVLHKCDNPKCVRPSHLFIGTQLDNIRDMINKGRKKTAKGSSHGSSKLTEEQVSEIKRSYIKGKNRHNPGNAHQLAEKYGVLSGTITDIVTRSWKHVNCN